MKYKVLIIAMGKLFELLECLFALPFNLIVCLGDNLIVMLLISFNLSYRDLNLFLIRTNTPKWLHIS